MSRRSAVRGLRLLVCSLCLLSYLHPASADAPERSNRRPMRRVDAVATDQVEDRTNAIDQPLDQALQLKYYDVVSVDLVHRLPAGADPAPDTLTLVAAGAGEGAADPEQTSDAKVAPPTPTKPEAAKTLADQVAEGKYGLIHRELFQRRPERLGILNYRRNEEVPLDDERNYGGLRPDEIWLAEDHLLVLKGGSIRHGSNRSGEPDAPAWQPIDDYRAPDRQVQIPANPAVPPPFPVQLRENGPIEFIRGRQVPAFNPFTNESAFLFTNKAFPVIRPEDFGGQHILAGPAAHNATGQHRPAGLQYPPPVNPPPVSDNRTYSNPFLKLPPPALYAGPPAGGSLDEARNRTAGLPPGLDEDDPSLYYPPPYTFEYRGNYTNPVPPGPLVPGIILPPPPNFFILKPAGGSNGTGVRPPTTTTTTTTDRPKATKPPKQYVSVRPHPTTTVAPPPPPPPPPPSVNSVAPAKIVPSRVEIQKAVLKTFVPVLEVYGAPPKPAKPAAKRPRPKPTVASVATATPAQTPSTKLHKIPPEQPTAGQRQPVYAEYFDVRTSTARPPVGWGDVGVPAGTPQLPRTYLPVGKVEQARPVATGAPPDYGYGYSPIEQFHREVQTIRQTLQIYEKANRLSGKGGRTSKAHHHHHHQQQQHPQPSLANLSLSFDGNVYRTLFPEEVVLPPQQLPSGPSYHRPQHHHQPQPYKPAYEPAYVYRPAANSVLPPVDLPTGYYVTSTDYGRHGAGYADAAAQSHPQYYQPTAPPPPPPPQPDLSYIAPVILNNGASGYNRRPDFDPSTTTTKSYLILDHRLQRPQPPTQPPLSPYLYRSGGGGGVPTGDGQQGVTGPARNRYLEGDILVNYKHPLPVLNPDSEFLPYHHRLKVRKRQNVRGAGEQKPRYHGQPLYNHR